MSEDKQWDMLQSMISKNKMFSYMLKQDQREKTLELNKIEEFGTAEEKLKVMVKAKDLSLYACGEDGINLPGFVPSYIIKYDDLPSVDVISKIEEHSFGWTYQFLKYAIREIELNDSSLNYSFKLVSGVMTKTREPKKNNIIKAIGRMWDVDDDIVVLLEKLTKKILDSEENVVFNYVSNETLKNDLLSMPQNDLDDLFSEYDNDQILNFFKHDSYNESIRILNRARQISEEYNLIDVIKKDEDWYTDDIDAWEQLPDIPDYLMEDSIKEYEQEEKKKKIESVSKSRKESGRKGGMKGGAKTTPVAIFDKRSKEVKVYPSKGECMKELDTSFPTFSQFLKGKSKLNVIYTPYEAHIVDEDIDMLKYDAEERLKVKIAFLDWMSSNGVS